MSRVGELSVDITADASRLRRELAGITGARGPLMAIGRVAGMASLAAGAAIAGVGARGIASFAEFDTSMREVFTLLPGITQTAMDEMEAEVIAFSNEFGKLPNEVIPALYQALSAGVPAGNVFEFLETANMAAVGGVANLTTAVDTLTSVTNAYGIENVSTQEASDALFTAIRLGKTDMDELGAVVARVTPIAASLGVGFDDVAAAFAAMTAQGVPTAEAATQLRALMNELSDAGRGAGQVFHEITGQTFPEFIAAGGDLEGALQQLAEYAEANGLRMTDVFGSIEASMGATVLTSETGSAAFGVALDAMGEKAGATQAAFETMDEGIQASWNRLTAGFNTLMVEVGNELAPMFQTAVDDITQNVMPVLASVVIGIFQGIAATTTWLKEQWTAFQTDTDGIYADIRGIVEAAGTAIEAVFNTLAALWDTVLKPAWDAIKPLVEVLWAAITTTIENNLALITGVLNTLAALLRGDFSGAWDEIENTISTVSDNTKAYVETAWNGIKTFLEGVFAAYVTAATDRWNEMKAAIETSTNAVKTWLEETWNGIKAWLDTTWAAIEEEATAGWEAVKAAVLAPIEAVIAELERLWNAFKEWFGNTTRNIAENAGINWGGVADAITGAFSGVVETIGGIVDDIAGRISAAWDSVRGLTRAAADAVRDAGTTVIDWVTGTESDPDRAAEVGAGVRLPHEGGGLEPFAAGGIVTGPMRAIVGEAGPEAIIPLDRLDRILGSNNQTIIVELDGRTLMRALAPRMVNDLRLRTGIA